MSQGGQGVASVPLCTSDGSGDAAPQYRWVDSYGALAFAVENGRATHEFWYSYNLRYQSEAESRALAECKASGKGDCRLATTFWNGFVGMAASDDGSVYWSGARDDKDSAVREAIAGCQSAGKNGCESLGSVGSLPWQE